MRLRLAARRIITGEIRYLGGTRFRVESLSRSLSLSLSLFSLLLSRPSLSLVRRFLYLVPVLLYGRYVIIEMSSCRCFDNPITRAGSRGPSVTRPCCVASSPEILASCRCPAPRFYKPSHFPSVLSSVVEVAESQKPSPGHRNHVRPRADGNVLRLRLWTGGDQGRFQASEKPENRNPERVGIGARLNRESGVVPS